MIVTKAQHEREKYHELLDAVASKFPGESRHQTALRYILNMEHGGTDGQRAAGAIDAAVPGIPRERDAERLRRFVDNNMTFMDVDHDKPIDGVPNVPALASGSRRIWYHATDDEDSYSFSAVIDAAISGDSHG